MDEETYPVEVRYFAAAAEATGCGKEVFELPHGSDLGVLRDHVLARYGAAMDPIMRVSAYLVGEEMTRDLTSATGDRVDILPPFAGG